MTDVSATEILRLARLEKAAIDYRERALLSGNVRLARRAVGLELAAYTKSMAIVRDAIMPDIEALGAL